MYLRASQSITSYNGYWENNQDGGICVIDKNLNMISEDLPKAHTYDTVRFYTIQYALCLEEEIIFQSQFEF